MRKALFGFALVLLSGCATIGFGTTLPIKINGQPILVNVAPVLLNQSQNCDNTAAMLEYNLTVEACDGQITALIPIAPVEALGGIKVICQALDYTNTGGQITGPMQAPLAGSSTNTGCSVQAASLK